MLRKGAGLLQTSCPVLVTYVPKVSAFILNKLPKFPDALFAMCEVFACFPGGAENFKTRRFEVKIERPEVTLLHDRDRRYRQTNRNREIHCRLFKLRMQCTHFNQFLFWMQELLNRLSELNLTSFVIYSRLNFSRLLRAKITLLWLKSEKFPGTFKHLPNASAAFNGSNYCIFQFYGQ